MAASYPKVPGMFEAGNAGDGRSGRYTAKKLLLRQGRNGMYPEIMVAPMREELTRAGVQETRTVEQVTQALAKPGTTLVIINSICGCAAGRMRPAVRLALQHGTLPDHKITVFAGQDRQATDEVRSHIAGFPPSSPSIALFRNGKLEFMMPRSAIETASAPEIAEVLTQAFDEICTQASA